MDPGKRLVAFKKLGEFFSWYTNVYIDENTVIKEDKSSPEYINWAEKLKARISKAEIHNPWFTYENVIFALKGISVMLEDNKLEKWTANYNIPSVNSGELLTIGVIPAGNIPLVGFSDFLCVLISGNKYLAKLSSKDMQLFPLVKEILCEIEPRFEERIIFTENKLTNFDLIIATGSNNTSRYFEYYFGKYPNIIRKNRTSIAIIDGNEKEEEMKSLQYDIITYFGLGCRNVSKIYIPENYSPIKIIEALGDHTYLLNHNKFANNYEYNKAIFLMNNIAFYNNSYFIFKEDKSLFPPVAVLYYEYYNTIEELKKKIDYHSEEIQCVVARPGIIDESVNPGQTQKPELTDYADNVDTLQLIFDNLKK